MSNQARERFVEAVRNHAQGDLRQAAAKYQSLLDEYPRRESILINLSAVYLELREFSPRLSQLINQLRSIDNPMADLNVGTYLFETGRKEEALQCFEAAFKKNPENEAVLKSMAYCLFTTGKTQDAGHFAETLAAKTNSEIDWGRAKYYYAASCNWQKYRELELKQSTYPFFDISRNTEEHKNLESARGYTAQIPQQNNPKHQGFTYLDENRKIRIGYLCGEFKEHATLKLLISVLEYHDAAGFEVFYYDNGSSDTSNLRKRFEATSGKLVDIRFLSDEEVVARACSDKVDILINLNGFFGNARNQVFFTRAAPIQVSFLGYPGTLAHNNIDYIIADRETIPRDNQEFYAEKVVYLPSCYQPNDDKRQVPHKVSRSKFSIPTEKFVFCCLNNNYKITKEIFDAWISILDATEESILLLLGDNPDAVANIKRYVTPTGQLGKIFFTPRLATNDYLELLGACDLFLDTYPYNAHTTGTDSLWASTPILTIQGRTFPSRVGSSLIKRAGLDAHEFITPSVNTYIAKAIALRDSPWVIAKARRELRAKVLTGGFVDMQQYTREYEQLLRKLHDEYIEDQQEK